ncbi:prepilin peptidase [Candidatus Gottesmanbacteria bacterium]|nr:prepilin peptidase [Candidatus Gottesmanbacteria bacterium]
MALFCRKEEVDEQREEMLHCTDMAGIVFLFGLAVGSFLNVLIDRLPRGQNVISDRSRCDHCKKTLRWFELIPVISFFVQGGRCRRCRGTLSWQYPIVELVTAVGFVVIYGFYEAHGSYGTNGVRALLSWYLIYSSFLVIFVADLKDQIIPDSMVLIGIFGAIGVIGVIGEHVLAGIGASIFFSVLLLITRGKGMGFGDVKFAFLMGLLLGFPKIIVASYLAFLTGAGVGVILILLGMKKLKGTVAFGPFLIIGTVVAFVWGNQLIEFWKKIV